MNNDQTPPTTTTTALAVQTPEQFIENGLSKFEITTESLEEFRSKYADLLTKEITNKKELEEVHKAQMDYVKKRGDITKKGKDIRSLANAFSKAVIAREDEYIAIISPDEIEFKRKKDEYNEKIRLQEEEDDRKEKLRIQDMLDKLNAVECVIDYSTLISMDDTQFHEYLTTATAEFQIIVGEREKQRLAEEQRLREEEAARKAEAERLEQVRIEQEERQKKFDEEQAAFREEQERVRKFNEEQANKIKEAEEKLAEEKRQIQEAKNRETIARRNAELKPYIVFIRNYPEMLAMDETAYVVELAEIKKGAELQWESDRQQAIKDEQAEKDRLFAIEQQKLEAEEKLKMGEDSNRFGFLAQQLEVSFLNSSVWSHMKSVQGREVGYTVHQLIKEAHKLCSVHASTVKTGVPMPSDGDTTGD